MLDAVQELGNVGSGSVGYWGVSLGCGLGVPFVTADPRVRAVVLGLSGVLGLAEAAARSPSHADVPRFEVDSTVRFFARHLGTFG